MRFAPGSLDVPAAEQLGRVKMLRDHDRLSPIGVLASYEDGPERATATFRFGRSAAAAEAADLAEDGVLDGLSVGVDPIEWTEHDDGSITVTRARLFEVSLVAMPALDNARATAITAAGTADSPDRNRTMPQQDTPAVPGQLDIEAAVRRALAEQQAAPEPTPQAAPSEAAPLPPGPSDGATITASSTAPRALGLSAAPRPEQYAGMRGRNGEWITAGDYVVALAAGLREGDWAKFSAIKAAVVDQLSSDTPGLLPQQIVGDMLGRASGRRPVFDSFSARAMPMIGEKFSRPKISQHVKVDEQATQKTEVASQKYKVVLEDVAKKTLGGVLDIAQQAIDWTSPALLNELMADFTRIYISRTETLACTSLVAGATGTAVTWDGKAATLNAALAKAAGSVYGALGDDVDAFPNTVWMSVDMWITLGGLSDETGRPLLPFIGAQNATGMIDLSDPSNGPTNSPFRWVVGKQLPAGTMIVGDRAYTESYENGRRFLQVVRPDVLGLDLAYMGYVACYFPYPKTGVPIKVTPPSEGK
ncbi:HK97 family phage prohead protease [Yinghuangia soli]|uniref:HK97 family phage prohead protease n=1 Tax=Yinghuangia soli TaxID=2908204 RepID=A0AA41Q1T3_9ACTN|nr:HK97 family phage prohead protease [Yinghuangia soli]MCF2529370.1 HK97 family phage prohead protease [Yinghuangia soli]